MLLDNSVRENICNEKSINYFGSIDFEITILEETIFN